MAKPLRGQQTPSSLPEDTNTDKLAVTERHGSALRVIGQKTPSVFKMAQRYG